MDFMNTFGKNGAVLPLEKTDAVFRNGKAAAVIRKLSWNVFRFNGKGLQRDLSVSLFRGKKCETYQGQKKALRFL